MQEKFAGRKMSNWIIAAVAILFGIMTVKFGGQVLFGDEAYRIAAGNYVVFVLWFNFVAGFIYLVAGLAVILRKPWSVWLSLSIAVATLLVFAALGVHIFTGGAYETRTVAAITLRFTVWITIFVVLYRSMKKGAHNVA